MKIHKNSKSKTIMVRTYMIVLYFFSLIIRFLDHRAGLKTREVVPVLSTVQNIRLNNICSTTS